MIYTHEFLNVFVRTNSLHKIVFPDILFVYIDCVYLITSFNRHKHSARSNNEF
jgi:hypothetical protein